MSSFNPFAGGEIERVVPSTGPQREVLAASRVSEEANTAFNEAVELSFKGRLDTDLLKRSFYCLMQRHDVFRCTFSRRGDELCLQADLKLRWVSEDLRSQPEASHASHLHDLKRNIAISPMNLEEGPLVFAWLIQLADDEAVLLIAAHHIVCDGWTFGLILEELSSIYNEGGTDEHLPQAPSFVTFSEQQDAEQIINRDVDFWRARFEVLPPVMDLPLDFSRPAHRHFAAKRIDYVFPDEFTRRLKNAAAAHKCSLVNMVLAGYFVLLHRLSGNEDLVVGLPVAGQAALNQLKLAGHLVQLLPVRLQFSGASSFLDVLQQVKAEVLEAGSHPNFTFGDLIKNMPLDRSRVPLINTIFNIDQPMPDLSFGDAVASVVSVPRAAESFELFLNVVPRDSGLTVEATYSSVLFEAETIKAWLFALETLLNAAVSHPEQSIDALPMALSEPEIVRTRNALPEARGAQLHLLDALARHAQSHPNKAAVICGTQSLSYSELWRQVENQASRLVVEGVAPNEVIGVCASRSAALLLNTLAILRAGASYLPLDPDFPPERLKYILQDAGVKRVVVDADAARMLESAGVTLIPLVEEANDPIDARLPERVDAIAYQIYTSGSTGQPKGVVVSDKAMHHFLSAMQQTPGLSMDDTLLAVTTLSFDISVLELFLPLVCGAQLVIAQSEQLKDAEALAELIEMHDISVLQATPATWRMLLGSSWAEDALRAPRLKALCGGEPLSRDLVAKLLPRVVSLWNMYGPTEATVWASCKQIKAGEEVSVGQPIAGTRIHVLDAALQPLPLSTPGELCIAGDGLAEGYHNRAALTQERFVMHREYGRIYRTGDVALWSPKGELKHLGRMDDQVKVRGFRIELGEIEMALSQAGVVQQAAAYLWEPGAGDQRIVACYVRGDDATVSAAALRKALRTRLPNYMMPQYFIEVDAIPLTPNGKVDRRALPRPQEQHNVLTVQGELCSDSEEFLASLWKKIIQPRHAVGREDNFFDAGGHSLLAFEFIRQVDVQRGVKLDLREVIVDRLWQLAAKLDEKLVSQESSVPQFKALSSLDKRKPTKEQLRIISRVNSGDGLCFHLPAAWRLSGTVDVAVFERAFQRVLERQTALRTVFSLGEDGLELKCLPADSALFLSHAEVSAHESGHQDLVAGITGWAEQPFDLEGALFRAKLIKLTDGQTVFCVCAHQLVFDGWSFDLLLKELDAAYSAYLSQHTPDLQPLALEYRDYCSYLAARQLAPQLLAYFDRALRTRPLFESSNETNQPESANRVVRASIKLDLQTLQNIEQWAQANQFKMHEVYLAAMSEALYREDGQSEVAIGMPVTGRADAAIIDLIGGFYSVLPWILPRPEPRAFKEYVHSMKSALSDFYQHEQCSLGELWDRNQQNGLGSPEISVSFAFQDVRSRPTALFGQTMSQLDIDRSRSEYPLEHWVRVEADGLLLVLDYQPGVVAGERMEKLMRDIADRLRSPEAEIQITTPRSGVEKTFWRRLFG